MIGVAKRLAPGYVTASTVLMLIAIHRNVLDEFARKIARKIVCEADASHTSLTQGRTRMVKVVLVGQWQWHGIWLNITLLHNHYRRKAMQTQLRTCL